MIYPSILGVCIFVLEFIHLSAVVLASGLSGCTRSFCFIMYIVFVYFYVYVVCVCVSTCHLYVQALVPQWVKSWAVCVSVQCVCLSMSLYLCFSTGSSTSVKKELDSVRQYIAEGVTEAETCGDKEMQAEFMVEAAMLNLIEGTPVEDTKQMLKVGRQGLMSALCRWEGTVVLSYIVM